MSSRSKEQASLLDLMINETAAASTGAAADAAEADERLKTLPRILRILMLRDREHGYLTERLIGEIAELCPGLTETTAWANARDSRARNTKTGLALAATLDQRAASSDLSELRSLADCVRLISLPVPHSRGLLAGHERVAKTLLMAQRALPQSTATEIVAEIEQVVWGWVALPFALHQLPPYATTLALPHAASLGERMARQRLQHARDTIRGEQDERERRRKAESDVETGTAMATASKVTDGEIVVCRIDDAMLKNPKTREVTGPFKHAINAALPLVNTPPLHLVRNTLLFEFPYAAEVVDFCLADLVGRNHVYLRPLLLVGPPGGGKSRLARRLGEVLGLQVWRTDASRSDGAVFGGTDKRWYSAEPCHPFLAIAQAKIANPMILIDEIEKAATRTDYGRFWDALLGFLEPETAARYPDPALQVALNLSRVSYVATANNLDPLPSPLRDRFRVVELPKPTASDIDALIPAVLADIATERHLDSRWIPPLDQDDHAAARRLWQGGSIRRLRRIVEAIINAKEKMVVRQ
jgi:ATP-dependent Lon protease